MKNYFWHENEIEYPQDEYFRPSKMYPEYQYKNRGISDTFNGVYEMIRSIFINLKLDEKNIGTQLWNPLGEYIKTGDVVLIKPNLVKHQNDAVKGKMGMDCLVTHPSVIRCILDYVIIALNGSGKIIVADAPVQGCDFNLLMEKYRYVKIEEFYKLEGIDIKIEDLRDCMAKVREDHLVKKELIPNYRGIEVNLGTKSYFYKENNKRKKYRVTNYDYHDLNKLHCGKNQKYCISEACLCADVIVNLPKPKSHRKAGYTGALKNMIGINTSKEYLPHHSKGAKKNGNGDEYLENYHGSHLKSCINDCKNILNEKKIYWLDGFMNKVAFGAGNYVRQDKYSEGSWWGNDTIWKTVLDVNHIVMYADKRGTITNHRQRKIITIGDMIYCGEKEGPLLPSAKKVSGILFSDNSVMFDLILVRLMGFRKEKIPTIWNAAKNKRLFMPEEKNIRVCSNEIKFNKNIDDIEDDFSFKPSSGWEGAIELKGRKL